MTIAFTELTALSRYDNSNVSANPAVYSTDSNLTAVANRLYVALVWGLYSGVAPEACVVAGGGLGTWTNFLSGIQVADEIGYSAHRASSASPGAGALVTFTFGNNDMQGCAYAIYEITGHNSVNPIGQTTIDEAGEAPVTSITPTLPSASPSSGILAGVLHTANEGTTVEGGWTEGEDNNGLTLSIGFTTASRTSGTDLSCQFSWATSTGGVAMIIEIRGPSRAQLVAWAHGGW